MALNDVKIIKEKGGRTQTFDVEDRTSSTLTVTIKPGEPLMQDGNYVIPITTGKPVIGTDEFIGIAQSESTETSAADGTVEVFIPVAGKTVLRCAATTPANIDTAAKLLAVKQDCVTFNDTSLTYTVDENEGDDPNVHGLKIIGGDIAKGTIDFVIQQSAGYASGTVGQTRD